MVIDLPDVPELVEFNSDDKLIEDPGEDLEEGLERI